MAETLKRIDPDKLASDLISQIDGFFDQESGYRNLDPQWQVTTRRIIVNSITEVVFAKRLGISESEALKILAQETLGMDVRNEELKAFILGIEKTGVMFGETVKRNLIEKLNLLT